MIMNVDRVGQKEPNYQGKGRGDVEGVMRYYQWTILS